MFRRFWRGCGRLPLFRLGAVLVILSQAMEALDALAGIDLAALLPAGTNVSRIVAAIGLLKIALRGVFVITQLFQAKPPEAHS
ncbi:hypothetical protein HL667_06300 [Bradyrhizobium sp. 83012]|uniref:DUF1622 domain-containing protein n=1 Tax=Bradyrhizobium aeschynomenes TaxID=2734909 RepID=A0ABX2CA04_9BRAD|nr:hypothetical protein [Bradyrhizobium aeschynomenes]NPU64603.1 hypothetical protein [Bradyrhizobium aeschynomenes]